MVLPRDTYTGPVLAGQRWRNRGQGGHDRYLVAVIRLASNSVQVVVEGAGGGGMGNTRQRAGHTRPGKRYNVPLDIFRSSYILVSQPKGYVEPTPLDEALAVRQFETEVRTETPVQAATSTAFGAIYSRAAIVADPIPPEHIHEVIETISAAREAFANPPEESEPMPEPLPDVPETPPLEAPIAPEPDDLDALFAATGRSIVDRLEAQISDLRRERGEYAALLDDLDARLADLHNRSARISGAIEVAIAAVADEKKEAPADPPEPPTPTLVTFVDQSVTQENSVEISAESVIETPEETAPPEGRIGGGRRMGQREFLTRLLRDLKDAEVKEVTVAYLAAAYAREFELPIQRASMNVSSIIVDQMKRSTTPDWPPMLRTGKGVYAFLG